MIAFSGDALKQKLQKGQINYGTCITSSVQNWPELIANTEFDFVVLYAKHNPLNKSELSKMCWIHNVIGLATIVRISRPGPTCTDDGEIGIIALYLENAKQIDRKMNSMISEDMKSGIVNHSSCNNIKILKYLPVDRVGIRDDTIKIK